MSHEDRILTVSIAAYNTGSSLGRTLASLECDEELFGLLDIIIVDDGSTDSTAEIAREFVSRHPENARLISKPNGGYGSTVNASIAAARGLYFKLLDGDDVFEKSGFEALLRALKGYAESACSENENAGADSFSENGAPDLVITPFEYDRVGVLQAGSQVGRSQTERTLCDRHPHLLAEPVRIEDSEFADGLMMFEICVRTEVLRRSGVRLTEHCFYTDNEFVMAALLYSSDVIRLPEPVYVYSIGVEGQSMSIEGRRAHFDDKIRAARGVFEIHRGYEDLRNNDNSTNLAINGSRRFLADTLLSTMTREVFVSGMIQADPKPYRKILDDFDSELCQKWPYAYEASKNSKLVQAVRKAGGAAYPLLCRRILKSETARMGGSSASEEAGMSGNSAGRADRSLILTAAEYIAAACMIVQCRTVYMHLENIGMIVNRVSWAVLMVALAVCIISGMRNGGNDAGTLRRSTILSDKRTLLIVLALAVYAGIFIAVNPVNYLRVIRCASAVIFMLILARSDGGMAKCRDILGCFRDLMLIIAGASLLFWFLGSVLKVLPCTGYLFMDWSAVGGYVSIPTFLNIYYETQWTGWEIIQARNTGFFVEAPMAGFAYSVALLIEVFLNGRLSGRINGRSVRLVPVVLLTAAVLSTFSLVCYGALFLIGAALLAERFMSAPGKADRRYKILTGAVIIIGFMVLVILLARKLQRVSGSVRINDFVVGFHAWLAHPFFGGGFESLEYLQKFMPEWRFFDKGFSNSPMEILAQGGIYLGSLYIYGFVSALVRSIRIKDIRLVSAVVIFAYLFTFTVVPYQYITFFMIITLYALPENEQKSSFRQT